MHRWFDIGTGFMGSTRGSKDTSHKKEPASYKYQVTKHYKMQCFMPASE